MRVPSVRTRCEQGFPSGKMVPAVFFTRKSRMNHEAARRCRRTRRLRTAAYILALLLVGVVTTAALPAHRYDYVLGAHASHPDIAYNNTMVMLQSL